MAEVEGAARSGLEGIAAAGDVAGVQQCGFFDAGFKSGGFQRGEGGEVFLDPGEEIPVLDERHFHGLDQAGAAGFLRLAVEEAEIVDHGERHGEGADPVLFAEGVDGAFHADPAVVLRQGGRGKPHEPDATVRGGRGESDGIEERSATDSEQVGMTVEVGGVDARPGFADPLVVGLDGFAAGQDVDAAEFDVGFREVALGLGGELRPSGCDGFLGDDQCAASATFA